MYVTIAHVISGREERISPGYCWHILAPMCCIWLCLSEKGALYSIVGEMFSLLFWISNNNPLCRVMLIKHTKFLAGFFSQFPSLHCLRDFIEQVKQLIVARLYLRWTLWRRGACSYLPTLITELSSLNMLNVRKLHCTYRQEKTEEQHTDKA